MATVPGGGCRASLSQSQLADILKAHTKYLQDDWVKKPKAPPGDLSHRPSGLKATSLATQAWLRIGKGVEFGTYHTARRLVKGKEKLKSVFRVHKKRAGTGSI